MLLLVAATNELQRVGFSCLRVAQSVQLSYIPTTLDLLIQQVWAISHLPGMQSTDMLVHKVMEEQG